MTLDSRRPGFDLHANLECRKESEAGFSRRELGNSKKLASDSATVFLIDPDPAAQIRVAKVAQSLRRRIEVFSSAEAFLDGFAPDPPGCLVSEMRLPGGSGLDLLKTLRSNGSEMPVLFLTSCEDVACAVEAIRAGALDVLEKPVSTNALAERVEYSIQQDSQIRFRKDQEKCVADRLCGLTRRERQVMNQVVEGLTSKQIAAQLDVSVKTVDVQPCQRDAEDECCECYAAARAGARVWVVSEYGLVDVRRPVELNRRLRREGLLSVRPGPFGDVLDTFGSRAFAVCDHQLAHAYVADAADVPRVRDLLASEPGVARTYVGNERSEIDLDHSRSGEVVVLAESDAWFAYPFWLDAAGEPDFARTIDIHRKPGYDPCELFFDPHLAWPKGHAIRRLVQKKLGFRTLFDVVPVDPTLVCGSHGLQVTDDADRPLLIGDGPEPDGSPCLPMTAVRDLVLRAVLSTYSSSSS